MKAKGVPIDGKRSPYRYPQEESPFPLKEESHWPPWDSVFLKRSPMVAVASIFVTKSESVC
jgi:hypothetical protein